METNALLNLLAPKTPLQPCTCFFNLTLPTNSRYFTPNPTVLLPLRRSRCPLTISRATVGPEANDFDTTPGPGPGPSVGVNVKPPDLMAVPEIKFRRGSRRRRSKQLEPEIPKPDKVKPPPKAWDDMSFAEKAMELYVGEKGLLFWLNKFAYASIFIMIGAWIVFRFVGPALNLYQLDAPPLSPEAVLKG